MGVFYVVLKFVGLPGDYIKLFDRCDVELKT